MGVVYSELVEKFDSWSEGLKAFMEPLQSDIWEELITVTDHELNALTQEILQLLFITTRRLLINHIPSGKFHPAVTDAQLVQYTASVSKTNVSPERDFAMLEIVLRTKPNATLIALESLILFTNNKTSQWLDEHTVGEKDKLFKAARLLAPEFRQKFKTRQHEIQQRIETSLLDKRKAIAAKLARELKEKERLTNEITSHGLWNSKADIIVGLATRKVDKVKLLKLQN